MILEEEAVTQADIIVLPPSKVDDQSDCEAVDENELVSSDTFPNDVAGLIEVQYEVDKHSVEHSGTTGKGKRKRTTELQLPIRKSDRAKKANKRYITEDDSSDSQRKRTREAMEENVCEETGIDDKHLEDDIEEADEPQVTSKVTKIKPATTKSETPKVQWTKQKPKYSTQPIDNEKHKVSNLIQDLITGYHQLPREEMYWENAEDCNTVHTTYKHVGYKHNSVNCTVRVWSRSKSSYFNGKELVYMHQQ